jgi:hypothetical protein
MLIPDSHSSAAAVGCIAGFSTYCFCTPPSPTPYRIGIILNAKWNKNLGSGFSTRLFLPFENKERAQDLFHSKTMTFSTSWFFCPNQTKLTSPDTIQTTGNE